MLVINPLGKDDVEFDDEVTTGTICSHLKLCGRVRDYVSSEGARHSLARHAKLCGGTDASIRSAKDFPIIEGIDGNGLHLEGFGE